MRGMWGAMARARILKPGFFKNDVLSECSFPARLLFAGLWTLADRDGCLEDRPKKIKGEIFPFDDVNCDALLNELAEKKFIVRYNVEEISYIQILTFKDHQNPHKNEPESVIPKPDTLQKNRERSRNESNYSGLNLYPDTLSSTPPVSPPGGGSDPPEIFSVEQLHDPRKRARGERLVAFMQREFPENPDSCPQDWGEMAVSKARERRPQTQCDFRTEVNWHFEKFYNHFASSTKQNARKSDWRKAWMNWWMGEFEKLSKQEERDEFFAKKRA